MNRENFYKLLVSVLTTIENERFVFCMKKEENLTLIDLNHMIKSSNLICRIYGQHMILFEDVIKEKEQHDFVYYQGDSEQFETDVIGLKKIKEILLSQSIEYPYLIFLYKIIHNLFIENENGIITLTEEEIQNISNVVLKYAIAVRNEERKLSIQRKRNR